MTGVNGILHCSCGKLINALLVQVDRVPTESVTHEKVLKFAKQFPRPGKSLKNGKKSQKVLNKGILLPLDQIPFLI